MDLSNIGGEIIYYEDSKTITILYQNERVRLQRAPTPNINDIIIEEEEKEDVEIPSSQNF